MIAIHQRTASTPWKWPHYVLCPDLLCFRLVFIHSLLANSLSVSTISFSLNTIKNVAVQLGAPCLCSAIYYTTGRKVMCQILYC